MANVFISYRHLDSEIAQSVAQRLRAWGFTIFIDTHIRGGEVWDRAIENELEAADAVVVLWSPNSVESDYVRNEARYAAARGKLSPVMVADCVVPVGLQHIQWIDARPATGADTSATNWNKLRAAIQHLVDRKGPDADGIQISVRRTYCPIEQPVRALAFFANDTELLMAYRRDFYGVELASNRVYCGMNTHAGYPKLALSGDRALLLQSSSDGKETLFRTHDLEPANETGSFEAHVTANALTRGGERAASAFENEIVIHEPMTGNVVSVLKGHAAAITSMAFSNDGFIVSASLDGTLKQWHVELGTCWRTFSDGQAGMNWVGLRSDGKVVFAASQDGFVRTWDVESGELLNKVRDHEEEIVEAALLLKGQFVLACYQKGKVVIWRTADGKPTASFDLKDYPTAIAVTEDSGLVAVAHGIGDVTVLNLHFGVDLDEARRPERFWT